MEGDGDRTLSLCLLCVATLAARPMTAVCEILNLAWRNGNGVGRINEFTLRRAWLVLG